MPRKLSWQSGVRSCIMLGLPAYLVQELQVCTVRLQKRILSDSKLHIRRNGAVTRLPARVLGVQSQAGATTKSLHFLLVIFRRPIIVRDCFEDCFEVDFVSYHRSCYLCRLPIQKSSPSYTDEPQKRNTAIGYEFHVYCIIMAKGNAVCLSGKKRQRSLCTLRCAAFGDCTSLQGTFESTSIDLGNYNCSPAYIY